MTDILEYLMELLLYSALREFSGSGVYRKLS